MDPKQLADAHGGHWGEHPDFPVRDWRHEVADDTTRLGHWSWVAHQLEDS